MEGFFSKKQTESKSRPDGRVYSCASCGLYKTAKSPKMKPYGNFKKEILIIGEAPGEVEDERGRQWQGKTGLLLKSTLRRLGIDLFEDCLNTNACACRPMNDEGQNRVPAPYEIDCCRRFIFKTIEEYQPRTVLLFGDTALYSVIGRRWKKNLGGIMKWRGFIIPDQDLKAWICPTFHPSYVERSEGQEVQTVWWNDLNNAICSINEPFYKDKKPTIHKITDLKDLKKLPSSMIAIDYETTGIKPQAEGHRIVCASIAFDRNHCFVFKMPDSIKERKPFVDILANNEISKIGHNIKHEENWSVELLGQPVENWYWDSMLATHILDNRTGITGLKFQTYVNFGVVDYDDMVVPYLKGIEGKNGNSMNKIDQLITRQDGLDTLLTYCAMDSIYTYRLAMRQLKLMNYDQLPF